ncbi:MAG: hypothetical protein Q4A16_03090 [Lautropia sp.]|nr:hypothetical protein [Lautropia sp.]
MPPHRQAGQALVLGMFLLVVVALLTFFQFSTGQVSATRLKLINATDAAAYSVGLWQARAMNYYAYSNRAIVANEVAIAQAVTMVSYSRFIHGAIERIHKVAQFSSLRAITGTLETLAESASLITRYAAQIEVAGRSIYNQALAGSQEVIFWMTGGLMPSSVANEVVAESDPGFRAFTVPARVLDNVKPTKRHTEEDRARLRDMVMRSLDGFTDSRSAGLGGLICMPGLERRGQTELILDHRNGLDRWQAYDTISLHRPRKWCRSSREALPLGWSGAEAAISDQAKRTLDRIDGSAGIHGDKLTNRNAYRRAARDQDFWSARVYLGLPGVRDLDYDSPALKANPRFPTIRVGVVARVMNRNAIGTAEARQLGAGRVQPRDGFSGKYPMLALSAAEVYFRRPPSADRRIEYASLYSPYWQVRLGPVPETWRQFALIYQTQQ